MYRILHRRRSLIQFRVHERPALVKGRKKMYLLEKFDAKFLIADAETL